VQRSPHRRANGTQRFIRHIALTTPALFPILSQRERVHTLTPFFLICIFRSVHEVNSAYYHDHICPSACPRGITRLQLARFSLNLKCGILTKICDKFRVPLRPVRNKTLYMATYMSLVDWSLQWRHCPECRAKWGLKNNWRPKHFVSYYTSRRKNISRLTTNTYRCLIQRHEKRDISTFTSQRSLKNIWLNINVILGEKQGYENIYCRYGALKAYKESTDNKRSDVVRSVTPTDIY
jgi:hypothetical protein